MSGIKAEWVDTGIALVGLLGLAFGGYGYFSAELALNEARISILEKEIIVSGKEREEMGNELDVLWLGTNGNKGKIETLDKDLSRFNESFEKFADAVDRLSLSVVRLEERVSQSVDQK